MGLLSRLPGRIWCRQRVTVCSRAIALGARKGCVFVRRSLVDREASLTFGLEFRDALNPSRIHEDYTGGLRQGRSSCFTVKGSNSGSLRSLTTPKIFTAHNISTTTGSHPHAVRRLCVGSAESEDQQVRSRHLVQVQSLISTTGKPILKNKKWYKKSFTAVRKL